MSGREPKRFFMSDVAHRHATSTQRSHSACSTSKVIRKIAIEVDFIRSFNGFFAS